jgi:hypothetical protein
MQQTREILQRVQMSTAVQVPKAIPGFITGKIPSRVRFPVTMKAVLCDVTPCIMVHRH